MLRNAWEAIKDWWYCRRTSQKRVEPRGTRGRVFTSKNGETRLPFHPAAKLEPSITMSYVVRRVDGSVEERVYVPKGNIKVKKGVARQMFTRTGE